MIALQKYLSLALIMLYIFVQPGHAAEQSYRVIRVVDGDTIRILYNRVDTPVRLIGVDTPETVHPKKRVQFYGKESSAFTRSLLEGESVLLEHESIQPQIDKYGRLLAYVYRARDGLFVNADIIRQGYGYAYTRYPFKYMDDFRKYERQAGEAEVGLWSADAVTEKEPDNEIVYITKTGTKYHRDGCRYLGKSKIPLKLSEAKKKYQPCSVCIGSTEKSNMALLGGSVIVLSVLSLPVFFLFRRSKKFRKITA